MRIALVVAAALALGGSAGAAQPPFTHAIVIVLENKSATDLNAFNAPAFTSLAKRYARLTDYVAVTHPSLPNYLALVSGSTHGITSDCTTCRVSGPTIASQIDTVLYAEGYPSSPLFAKKHAPFLYFPGGAAHVQPLSAFDRTKLPDVAFVVPDLCHDMHDCPVPVGDAWLKRFVTPLLQLPGTAIFVVFDEGSGSQVVPAAVLGTTVRPGSVDAARSGHYSLLRTLEDAWGVRPLGAARTARPIVGIWK